ncbi:MAG: FAD:protein FMN transferase [Lautropia sp.]|nr:FAD:protein FMN transferase [Lautropia sp.]
MIPFRRPVLSTHTRHALTCLILPLLAACQPPLEKLHGLTMGSTWHISYVREGKAPKPDAVQAEIQQLLDDMDRAVSTYRNDSDVARFNAAPAGTCMTMPPVVTRMLAPYARQLHTQSDSAFDITLLPALDAWGFGPKAAARKAKTVIQPGTRLDDSILTGKQPAAAPGNSPSGAPSGTPPSTGTPAHAAAAPRPPAAPVTTAGQPGKAELAALRGQIGLQHLRIDGDQLCKDAPISIEFNSIAAGAVIDQIADRFQALGIDSYLIEVTGELRAQGTKPDGSPWRIAIEAPIDGSTRQAQKILSLNGQAVSTSGDYRQYREENGQRLSHILDPRSLRPITHRLAAVTVLHREAMQADGLSTLLMVLGPEAGHAWAVQNEIAALFVSRADGGFETKGTPAFEQLHGGK